MGKKKIKLISGILATALTAGVMFSGCSLIRTNSTKDMSRTVAEVDISKTEVFKEDFGDKSEYFDSIGTTKVIKRELITYFVNVGYSYMQSYNWDYEETFNNLVDMLANNAILTQYATMYLLDKKGGDAFETFSSFTDESKKYEYLLGETSDDVKIAKYSLRSSVNSAIDTIELRIIDSEDTSNGSDTRSTPGNVDTEQDDYYPKLVDANGKFKLSDGTVVDSGDEEDADYVLDYNIYTGYEKNKLENSGAYKTDRDDVLVKNSDAGTRVRAYTRFISSLISYGLVNTVDEDLTDVNSLQYIQDEYVNQLKSRVINKYYDMYEEEQMDELTGGNSYLNKVYKELYNLQSNSYKTESAFSTAIGNMSDTSFILYAPKTENDGKFGFVYNILLPFSTSQSASLSALQALYADEDVDSGYSNEYYVERNKILRNIKTTDQRRAWFDGATEYAFSAKDNASVGDYYRDPNGGSDWLFFENNLTNSDRYKSLDKYIGKYAYNGTVIQNDDGKYIFGNARQLDIEAMISEFTGYVNFVLNDYKISGTNHVTYEPATGYYDESNFYKAEKNDDKQNQIDYSKLVYGKGKVDVGTVDRASVLKKDTAQYKAMAAVNELQYAYTTDTSVLSQYIGYTVDAGDTSYIKEFEYAAHEAVNNGPGSFTICAGDYGWHLMYVTYTFDVGADGGAVYETPNWENIKTEGTFEYLFYEWIKSSDIANISDTRRTQIISKYNVEDTTVKKYEKAYKNLLNLG